MVTIQLPGAFHHFLQKTQLKTAFMQMLIETVIFNLSRPNTFLEDSSFQYLFGRVVFNWVGVPNFWEGRVENRAKRRKDPISLGLKGKFSNLSLKR